MDDEVFRQITRVREYFADTKNYYLLLRHAKFMASRYSWFGSRSQSMPKANLPVDVVHELVEQVLNEDINSKTRRKLPEDIEIGKALRMQLRSKLSALSESRENRTVRRETDLVRDTDDDGFSHSILDSATPLWEQTDEEEGESMTALADRVDRFLEFVADDHLIHAMVNLARNEGIYKPAEAVADRLDVAVNDIYVAKKRMITAGRRFIKFEQIQK